MESKQNQYILAGLTVFCILLIGITAVNDEWLAPLRTGVGYVLIPIQSGVNKVGVSIYQELSDYGQLKGPGGEPEAAGRDRPPHRREQPPYVGAV